MDASTDSSCTQCRYFQYSYITPPLPYRKAGKHTLYVHFPHGSFPMGSWLSVGATQQEGLFQQEIYQLASNQPAERLLLLDLEIISQALQALAVHLSSTRWV